MNIKPIRLLKKEAKKIRKNNNNIKNHSDSLEIIARKYNYLSWSKLIDNSFINIKDGIKNNINHYDIKHSLSTDLFKNLNDNIFSSQFKRGSGGLIITDPQNINIFLQILNTCKTRLHITNLTNFKINDKFNKFLFQPKDFNLNDSLFNSIINIVVINSNYQEKEKVFFQNIFEKITEILGGNNLNTLKNRDFYTPFLIDHKILKEIECISVKYPQLSALSIRIFKSPRSKINNIIERRSCNMNTKHYIFYDDVNKNIFINNNL